MMKFLENIRWKMILSYYFHISYTEYHSSLISQIIFHGFNAVQYTFGLEKQLQPRAKVIKTI